MIDINEGYVVLRDENGNYWKVSARSEGGLTLDKIEPFGYSPVESEATNVQGTEPDGPLAGTGGEERLRILINNLKQAILGTNGQNPDLYLSLIELM